MTTRNAGQFLIEKFKESGAISIIPHASLRFVSLHLDELPRRYQSMSRDELVKAIREICESAVSTGKLKRHRENGVSGYIYRIL